MTSADWACGAQISGNVITPFDYQVTCSTQHFPGPGPTIEPLTVLKVLLPLPSAEQPPWQMRHTFPPKKDRKRDEREGERGGCWLGRGCNPIWPTWCMRQKPITPLAGHAAPQRRGGEGEACLPDKGSPTCVVQSHGRVSSTAAPVQTTDWQVSRERMMFNRLCTFNKSM